MALRLAFLALLMVTAVWPSLSYASIASFEDWEKKEREVGKEIEIPDVRLLYPRAIGSKQAERLERLGIYLAYVNELTRPGKGNGLYTCSPAPYKVLMKAALNVSAAMDKLSDEAIKNLKLKYILLCSKATARGSEIGGIPVPPIKTLMLAIGRSDNANAHRVFFHELYHYMEYIMIGGINDPEWDKLFGTAYTNEHFTQLEGKGEALALGSGGRGYITRYGRTLPYEERAEIFSFLMYDPNMLSRYIIAKKDELLALKVDYVAEKTEQMFGTSKKK